CICSMDEVLHLPPWMNEWMVSEAKACQVDAAVILAPQTHRMAVSGTKITRNALEAAGVPVFFIEGDMVDGSKWKHDEMANAFSEFLNQRVEPQVRAREGRG